MTLQEALLDTVQQLPPEQQQEVLDFAEFLKHRGKNTSRRQIKGLWSDLDFDLTEADLAEARQEMWGNFPRELTY